MSEEIEKLIKVQVILNRDRYHLCIHTDLENNAEWYLYQVLADYDHYMSFDNSSILNSKTDTIDDLINYLEKHNGFGKRF